MGTVGPSHSLVDAPQRLSPGPVGPRRTPTPAVTRVPFRLPPDPQPQPRDQSHGWVSSTSEPRAPRGDRGRGQSPQQLPVCRRRLLAAGHSGSPCGEAAGRTGPGRARGRSRAPRRQPCR